MQIQSFKVQGFAHFVEPVTLAPLREINVLYGPNNAGKSCLLRAVDLYFRLLGAGEAVTKAQRHILDKPEDELFERLTACFTRGTPTPIRFEVQWSLTDADLHAAGLHPDYPCGRVVTTLEA